MLVLAALLIFECCTTQKLKHRHTFPAFNLCPKAESQDVSSARCDDLLKAGLSCISSDVITDVPEGIASIIRPWVHNKGQPLWLLFALPHKYHEPWACDTLCATLCGE